MHYPEIVYKYRDWSKKHHKKILLNSELFLASPGSFNDPFDCRIPENFHLINTPEKIEEFIKETTEKHKDKLIELGYDVEERNNNLRDKFNDINAIQKENEEYDFKLVDECYGVLSLSARWNSLLMWSHYGNEHKGFCVGFDERKLRESKLFDKGGMVNYTDEFPVRNPLEKYQPMIEGDKQLNHKAKEWLYEQEYRAFILNPNGLTESDRKIIVPDSFIVEINLGIKIPEKHKQEITEFAKAKNISVYQVEKVPFMFELTRRKI